MPAQDMLDVVHYCFESDSIAEKETHDAKLRMRRTLYSQLYERPYHWGEDTGEFGTQNASGDHAIGSAGPPQLSHKPYVPPTPVNANAAKPYGTVLDAPLG